MFKNLNNLKKDLHLYILMFWINNFQDNRERTGWWDELESLIKEPALRLRIFINHLICLYVPAENKQSDITFSTMCKENEPFGKLWKATLVVIHFPLNLFIISFAESQECFSYNS